MRRLSMRGVLGALLMTLLVMPPVLSQGIPTGKLTGTVTAGGDVLPGVRVSVSSPALQRNRESFTANNGAYLFAALPPGTYEVVFSLDGFQSQRAEVLVVAAQSKTYDTELQVGDVTEEIIVVGNSETFTDSPQSSTTYEFETIEALPINRDLQDAVLLAPGVQDTGPGAERGNPVISVSGSQSYESLFMVNGVTVNENLRGQPLDLFIEDAIQETTTSLSGVSAELGRFTGGVVNAITKSGGNEFHGSLRINARNQDWEATTPAGEGKIDDIEETPEATLGGFFVKDYLWFFAAARTLERDRLEQLQTGLQFPQAREQDRLEGKLTISPAQSHSIVASIIDISDTETNNDPFGIALEPSALSDREDPQQLVAINYTGAMTSNFFVEAQYSERELSIGQGQGATGDGLLDGTNLIDISRSSATFYIPYFCAECTFDERDNESSFVKGSYFLTTENAGSHDLVFGYDEFSDQRGSENHQSPSGFSVWVDSSIITDDGQVFPVVDPNGLTSINWYPIDNPSRGADLTTQSFFVNDRWQLNEKWSFNIGLRYDENDGQNSAAAQIADDSKLSPRLGATYDLKGDGDLVLNASYSEYVAQLNTGIADSTSTAGAPSYIYFDYDGPAINTDPGQPLVSSRDALDIVFDWFEGVGFTGATDLIFFAGIPGSNTIIRDSLSSPGATEIAAGLTKRLGSKGLLRADLVRREFDDFYIIRRDTTTGKAESESLGVFDLGIVGNDNSQLEREYTGLHTQFSYRFSDRFQLAGNYTLSNAEGNFDGETRDFGPVAGDRVGEYPELKAFAQNNPSGDLQVDSRHKVRLWAIYDLLDLDRHKLSVSALQRFSSGTPYGARGRVRSGDFVGDLGFETPPREVNYYFTDRDAFTTDDVISTDLSLNYSFTFGKSFEVFLQPEVLNVFNGDAGVLVNTTVLDATTSSDFEPFNPFTDTPVQGVHWDFGPNFGQALRDTRFQQPRTFRLSVGFRF